MKKQLILSSVIFMMLTIVACKKGEQGDIGPAGVAGAAGAKGTTGDKGIADAKGLVSSDWIAVKGTDWRAAANPNSYFVQPANIGTILTPDMVNKGMLYFYIRFEKETITIALPYADASIGRRFYALAGVTNGVPAIQFYQSVTPPLSTFSTSINFLFRYVAVPAGARVSNIDWSNYEDVKRVLNLKD